MEEIIKITGVVLSVFYLFSKWEVWDKLSNEARATKYNFVSKLLNCQFCIMFHITWMVSIGFTGLTLETVSNTFIVTGFINYLMSRV